MMKKYLFLLVPGLLSAICLFSQTPQNLPADARIKYMLYENSYGEKGFTNYYYNSLNQLYKELWMLQDSSRYSETMIEYPAAREVRRTRVFSFDNLSSLEIFKYNDKNMLVREDIRRSDGPVGYADHSWENGMLVKSVCDLAKGWLTGEIVYSYENGKLKLAKILIDKVDKGTVYYECDAEGKILEEYWDFGSWNQLISYIYEENGCLRQRYSNPFIKTPCRVILDQEYYNYSGKFSGTSRYLYNESRQAVEKHLTGPDSARFGIRYTYDAKNRIKTSGQLLPNGKEVEYTYNYDQRNNLVSRQFIDQDSITGFEIFYYDKNDRLIKAVYENTDYWIWGELDLTYNLFEEIDKAVMNRGRMKGSTVSFEYINGLLVYMHWKFTDDVFQEYMFSYRKDE